MAWGRLRLHHRIVIPFALVALATTSAAAFVAVSVTSQALESRVKSQVLNTATLVAQSDFALNPVILRSVKAITGADVDHIRRRLARGRLDDRAGRGQPPGAGRHRTDGGARRPAGRGRRCSRRTEMDCGAPCYVAYRRVGTRPDTVVAVVADTSELSAATRRLALTVTIGAALSLTAMIIVSQFVARRVTAPIDDLVAFTREVSPDGSPSRARTGHRRDRPAGGAFNEMLDRLDRSRDALVRSEKLGLAGLMAARVAHDIRNPLSSIKMQTQLVGATVRDDAQTQAIVAAMLRDIQQVEVVVRDLIELARPGELKRQPALINELVGDVLSQLSLQLAYRKIAVDLELAEQLPPVNLDPERFRQVLRQRDGQRRRCHDDGRHVARRHTGARRRRRRRPRGVRRRNGNRSGRFATGCSIRSYRPKGRRGSRSGQRQSGRREPRWHNRPDTNRAEGHARPRSRLPAGTLHG